MSAAKLALISKTPFMSSLPRMYPEEQFREPEGLAKRYEILSRLSLSLASQRPEDLPCNLGALILPLLDFDFLDLICLQRGYKRSALALHRSRAVPAPGCSHRRNDVLVGLSAETAALHLGLETGRAVRSAKRGVEETGL